MPTSIYAETDFRLGTNRQLYLARDFKLIRFFNGLMLQ
jgi:hypothetical protein